MPTGFPDVLILGTMRGGTTFLHESLRRHPGIAASALKEYQFFSLNWQKGTPYYRRQLPRRWPDWLYRVTGSRRPILVDASPYYLFHPEAPKRAQALLGARYKAIALLREPGARAWSHYRVSLSRGLEHLGFLDAIACEDQRLEGESERLAAGREQTDAPHQVFSYIARGRYAEQIRRWRSVLPEDQLLLLRSEDMFARPQAVFDRICSFLGLDSMPLPEALPRNDLPNQPMPAAAREKLRSIFAKPNNELAAMTGISFDRT